MFSMACAFAKGREIWRVSHEAERGITHLDVTGTPPKNFEEIRTRLLRQQTDDPGGADYVFDIPVDLAQSLTGFRYDEDIEGAGDKPFEILEPR